MFIRTIDQMSTCCVTILLQVCEGVTEEQVSVTGHSPAAVLTPGRQDSHHQPGSDMSPPNVTLYNMQRLWICFVTIYVLKCSIDS